MNEFENILMCFIVPCFAALFYVAGKGDLLNLSVLMLQEKTEEINKRLIHEADEQGWISVKEQLPDKGMRCLGYTGSCTQIAVYEGNMTWFTDYNGYSAIGENLFTHWMPLPKAPKEEY